MNFIFFNPDELRAESVGCYGHPAAPTPHLDQLAAAGTRFDQCHVQHPVCSPSRCSLMTGWYPHVRGHRTLWHLLRPDEPNLLKYLKRAGYDIYWGGKNDLLAPESFAESVTDYRLGARSQRALPGVGPLKPPYPPDDPRYYSFLYDPAPVTQIEQLSDFRNVDGAIELLRSQPKEPFAIYLPLTFPHCPYYAPPPWHDLIDPASLPPLRPADLPDKPDFHHLIRSTRRLDQLDETTFRMINAVYLGMIGVIDYLLGQLLTTLEETGLADTTAIFVYADHGDWAGDYGLVEKWPSALDDTITRVPLIARIPGGKAGQVVHEQVELFDLMATTLELAGIEAEHTHFAQSFVPQLHGAAGNSDRAVFAEGGYATHEPHLFEGLPARDTFAREPGNIYYPKGKLQQDHPLSVCRATMIRTQTHKLIYRAAGRSEFYDLQADPRELHNLYDEPAHASLRHALESQLLAWYQRTSDVTPFDEDPRGLPPA